MPGTIMYNDRWKALQQAVHGLLSHNDRWDAIFSSNPETDSAAVSLELKQTGRVVMMGPCDDMRRAARIETAALYRDLAVALRDEADTLLDEATLLDGHPRHPSPRVV